MTKVLKHRNLINTQVWERIHIVHSLYKDLALPDSRAEAIYSNDDMVVSEATRISSFVLVSWYLLSAMLFDKKVHTTTFPRFTRLEQRHDMTVFDNNRQ